MKILKIELQNINSLKSDSPIVIDFENEHFKDVGLYAITGSTGAGKTTILDAITIALYHSVPRFKGTKATLIDVVSHGATDAFTRVTFENEKNVFEAFWGIRLASNTGKLLKNPQEEVSLKNLTTSKNIASQKKSFIKNIIKVTQLDYDQFLRSVLLAQGEFASFLTAKGPEKGRLLEQITGEKIYKKIGQAILERKSKEENILKEIQAKINADDILSEERKLELLTKDKELDLQIIAADAKIASNQKIVNWYVEFNKTKNQTKNLEEESKLIQLEIKNHKEEFQLLELNEKAEPFKEIIQSFNRNEKNSAQKIEQFNQLEEELKLRTPIIENLQEVSKTQTVEIDKTKKEFTNWLPKFDLITKLDNQITNENEHQQKTTIKLDALNVEIERHQKEKNTLSKNKVDIQEKIKIDEKFIIENNFLTKVDAQISDWTKELTTLKTNKEILQKEILFISKKQEELQITKAEFIKNKEILDKKIVEIEKLEKEIAEINSNLSKNNLNDLIAEEKKLSIAITNWNQFKNYSKELASKEKNFENLSKQKKLFLSEFATIKKQLGVFKKDIEIQEKAVIDAEKILDLEKSLSKYEDDRKKLEKGKPCSLCGSKEHPFAKHLETIGVSESELELEKRREQLKFLNNSKTELEKNQVKLSTENESLSKQISSIFKEIKSIQEKAKLLEIKCDINDLTKIDSELKSSTEKIKIVEEQIKFSQKLQIERDNLFNILKEETKNLDASKTKNTTFIENIKNVTFEIEGKQKSTESLQNVCNDLTKELKNRLSAFKYDLPKIEHTNSFIESIEKSILMFNNTQKNIDVLKSDLKVLNTNLIHIEKLIKSASEKQEESIKTIRESKVKSTNLKTERSKILPLHISVDTKRESLQLLSKQLSEKLENTKNKLQKYLDAKMKREALIVENSKEQKSLHDELLTIKSSFESHLKNSDFSSKEAIEKALLSKENKEKYTQLKDIIKERKIKLNTLKETNLKAIKDLSTSKNFEISEEETKNKLTDLQTKKDSLSAEKGEVKEAFRKDQEIKDRNTETYQKIDTQNEICNVWRDLFKIIGNSKEAFNVYVQRLTLKHLLDLANVHLFNLNKRYSLKMEADYKPKEELNFNLIDHYQTDQARLVDTSSGGEKFIISLALALGLSDLASKNVKIDSLFIDEGFGTLDSNTLETVISTLETLQGQGKMIGIISHVENLKERIPTQIKITKKSNGVSVVDVV